MGLVETDVLIVGAGVVGSALARRLAADGLKVAVLEQEDRPARHTSGRNSGVLHSGFNPKPGSLKARLCVEGNRRARAFCRETGVAMEEVGTLVVALKPGDDAVLESLLKQGRANGVDGLRMMTGDELRSREPRSAGHAALFAPTGAIVDNVGFVTAVARQAADRGASFFFDHRVRDIEPVSGGYRVAAGGDRFRAAALVNCAGLQADRIAHLMDVGRDYSIIPFRGQYWRLKGPKSDWVRSMIYPAPDVRFPFLGVHWTRTVRGETLAGPNAVLAFGRESYRVSDVRFSDTAAMLADRRFWKMLASPAFRSLARDQMAIALSRRRFAAEAATLLPGITPADLDFEPRAGNRPQLVDRDGRMLDDIVIEEKGTSVHVLNAVSPGFTCSLAFADELAAAVQGRRVPAR